MYEISRHFPHNLTRKISKNFFNRWGDIGSCCSFINKQYHIRASFSNTPEPLLALPECFLHMFVFSNIPGNNRDFYDVPLCITDRIQGVVEP